MRGFKIKVVSFIFIFLLLIGVYFVFSVSLNQKAPYPNPKNYAPNFWFDTEEKYFPCSPLDFNYDKNLNELPAEEAKAKYDSLSIEEKLNYFTVFCNVIDNSNQWIYEYHLYYVFNEFTNEHYGDWERVDVYVDKNTKKPTKVIGFAHNGSKTKIILANNELDNPKTNHQRILVEKGSHASCPDGNNDGLYSRFSDVSNWNSGYGVRKWSLQDKLYGPKIKWNDKRYRLISINDLEKEYSQKYSLQKRVISKAENLGIDLLEVSKINKIRSFQNKHIYIAKKLAGSPPSNPWQRKEYYNPKIAQPIKNPIKQLAEVFSQKFTQFTSKTKDLAERTIIRLKEIIPLTNKQKENLLTAEIKKKAVFRQSNRETPPMQTYKEEMPESSKINSKKEIKKEAKKIEEPSNKAEKTEKREIIEKEKKEMNKNKEDKKKKEKKKEVKKKKKKKKKKEKEEINWCSLEDQYQIDQEEAIFNEIAWMGTEDSSYNEWIELKNLTGNEIDLTGWQIQNKNQKLKLVFPEIKIPPYGFILLERTDDDSVPDIKADLIYKGAIRNSNEALFLFDKNCKLKDRVEADSSWPAGSNLSFRTMERKKNLSWQTSKNIGGTPKKENSSGYVEKEYIIGGGDGGNETSNKNKNTSKNNPKIYPKILISEVYIGSEGNPKDEFVELYNPNNEDVNLSGWYILRKTENAKSFSSYATSKLFSNKKIPKKGYFLIARKNSSFEDFADVIIENPLASNNTLVLKNPNKEIVDEINWKEIPLNKSYGRKWENNIYKDTDNCEIDFEIQKPTPKAKNEEYKNQPPIAKFTFSPSISIVGQEVKFDACSSSDDSSISFYLWNFNNKISSSTSCTTTYTFINSGEFEISLKVVDEQNASSTATSTINVLPSPSLDVVINEIAWMGTASSTSDEWMELYNNTASDIDLTDWKILKNGKEFIRFSTSTIPAHGFYLLERTDDNTISDIKADLIYKGTLKNAGERLELVDKKGNLIDLVDCSNGWFAGSNETKQTMERVNSREQGYKETNWKNNNGIVHFGKDAGGNDVLGTPKKRNSVSSIYVPYDFSSIQKAIDNAYTSSTIYVYPQTYNENLVIQKPIKIIGIEQDQQKPKLMPGDSNKPGILVKSHNVEVRNFNVSDFDKSKGIFLENSKNCVISNNLTENNDIGIYIKSSKNNYLENNLSRNNRIGIHLCSSKFNNLTENQFSDNDKNFIVEVEYENNIDKTNKSNKKPIYYLVNQEDKIINGASSTPAFIYLINCKNVTIENVNIENEYTGISLVNSSSTCAVLNSEIKNCFYGISLLNSSSNLLEKNYIASTSMAVKLDFSSYNKISENKIENCLKHPLHPTQSGIGIYLYGSYLNEFNSNCISKTQDAAFRILGNSNSNIFFSNKITENKLAFDIHSCSNNEFFKNHIIENEKIISSGSACYKFYNNDFSSNYENKFQWSNCGYFYNEKLKIGNHYDFYDEAEEGCIDEDNDNICDLPLHLFESISTTTPTSMDKYPLVSFSIE